MIDDMKTKIATGILVIAAIALVSGATILATATPGTQENPFVTLDYLNNKFKPEILEEARAVQRELSQSLDKKIADMEDRLRADPGDADTFVVVTLSAGQTLSCSVGAEIMLRIGSAAAVGSDPALVCYTNGETISDGAALTPNYMYLVTIEGNGVRASDDTVKLLARGDYSIK